MLYRERIKDLFSVDSTYTLVHCVSADFAMGAGIAKRFTEMGVKKELQVINKNGRCLKTSDGNNNQNYNGVYNLITKERYFHKPTYETMASALLDLRYCCERDGITKLAMPKIGCGLDRLNLNKVYALI